MQKFSQEKIGELLIMAEVVMYSFFPIIINHTSKLMPPVLFAGVSALVAGIAFFFHLILTGRLKEVLNKEAIKYCLAVTFFIIVIPALFIFPGTKLTTGVNTTIFLQTEALFALIICALFFNEKITKNKLLGSILIACGAIAVIFNGTFNLNFGDILIVLGVMFYPFGNIYAKKALKLTSPAVIVFIRSIIGGTILILISFIFEHSLKNSVEHISNNITYIMINGIVVMAISKIAWYEGLRRMEISKATSLGMTYPGLSLIFAILILKETPSTYQILGLITIMIGAYLITKRTSKSQKSTLLYTTNPE